MRILDRYLWSTVLKSTVIVLSALLSLFALITFIDEVSRNTGQGRYDAVQAAKYVALMVPGLTYQLFPPAALLGSMVGLGGLAATSELTAIRAAGFSIGRITRTVLGVGMAMVVATAVVGEGVAPWAVRKAELLRTLAISGEANLATQKGLWLRQGHRAIRIGQIEHNGILKNIEIVELDPQGRVHAINRAESAVHEGGNHWRLSHFQKVRFTSSGAAVEHLDEQTWDGLLTTSLLEVVTVRANTMPIWTLYNYIDYLQTNQLAADNYVTVLWNKLLMPVTIMIMVLLAVPIIFGPLRTVGASTRIFAGTMIGVGFYLMNQIAGYVGLVFHIDPRIAVIFPILLFAIFAYALMRRIR